MCLDEKHSNLSRTTFLIQICIPKPCDLKAVGLAGKGYKAGVASKKPEHRHAADMLGIFLKVICITAIRTIDLKRKRYRAGKAVLQCYGTYVTMARSQDEPWPIDPSR